MATSKPPLSRTAGIPGLLTLKWAFRMLADVVRYGWVNRSFGMVAVILALLGIAILIGAAAASAPWVYTLF
jgi:hypothetical protein